MFIECTKKLFDTMKTTPNDVLPIKRNPFYEWHANLFLFDRKKGVLLMNNHTRYSIILYDLKAKHFKNFDTIVLDAIKETFLAEGLSETKVDKYIANCGEIIFTKTHDRSILSQMNDFLISISWNIEKFTPSDNVNLVEMNKWSGEMLSSSIGYEYPINILKKEMSEI